MTKHSTSRKLTALFTAFVLLLGILPASFPAQGLTLDAVESAPFGETSGSVPAVLAGETVLSGEGTAENPYLIGDAAEFAAFRDLVNAVPSAAFFAKLTDDIDLGGTAWTPIYPTSGYITEAYAGTFDGNGHTVRGLSINTAASYQGLFGAVNGAVIKNLCVEGEVSSSGNYIGGIVGKLQQGTVENCSFSGSVSTSKSNGYVGGITGYAGNTAAQTGTLTGCVNRASVTAQNGIAGGIAGYAKYTAFSACYNAGAVTGGTRSGGIAGQMQNNVTADACYNVGTVSGSSTAAELCDFLYSSAKLESCFWLETATGAGTGTVADSCGKIVDADSLLHMLNEALPNGFVADVSDSNGGYPLLAWQAGAAPVDKNPSIQITGNTALAMTNDGSPVMTTLTVTYTDMDAKPAIVWTVSAGADVVRLESPQNAGANSASVIVYATRSGKATVQAATADGAYTAACEIAVIPFITTVEIDGIAAAGETVCAKVHVLGGGEYDYENDPALSFCWKYLTGEDYAAGNTGSDSYRYVGGAVKRTFTIPADFAGNYLSFDVSFGTQTYTLSSPVKTVTAAEGVLLADRAALTLDTADIKAETVLSLPKNGSKGSVISWASDNEARIDPSSGSVTLPQTGIETVTLTAELSYQGAVVTKAFTLKLWSLSAIEEERADKLARIENTVSALGDFYKLYPAFGTDTNVADMLKADLDAVTDDGIAVSVKAVDEVYGGAAVALNGDIRYYYADPNTSPIMPFGSFAVTFELTLEDAAFEVTVPVIVYWDADKVKQVMTEEILDKVTFDVDAALTEDLVLPQVVDGKRWTLVSWTSSDESVVSVETDGEQTADTLFEPLVGKLHRGTVDRQATLTATFTFGLTNDDIGSEAPIVLHKVFAVTVKALDAEEIAAIRAELAQKLESGFALSPLSDAISGEPLTETDGVYTAYNDLSFPTTQDFGVDGKQYPVSITSDNTAVVCPPDANNAARAVVYRPAVGKESASVNVTLTITDTQSGIAAAKTFALCVPALTEAEIAAEQALMDKVAAAYFDGIRGNNTEADDIRYNLSAFVEVYEQDGELVWVRDRSGITGIGIVPTALEGWEELEAWRLFKSSNPAVVAHETLKVTLQNHAKAVTVSSALSSQTLGKYGELYQSDPVTYADYAALAGLYYRTVSADLVVRGKTTSGSSQAVPVEETINVTFRLLGADQTLIGDTKYTGLDEATTAFDVFRTALAENGYTYAAYGSYVYAITTDDGTTIAAYDAGPYSGWMYKVGGRLPDVSMSAYGLKNGDVIEVFYVVDYNVLFAPTEVGGVTATGGTPAAKPSETPAADEQAPADEEAPADGEAQTDAKENTPGTDGSAAQNRYTDIGGHWAEKEILTAGECGWMNGVAESVFAPDEILTRAMFVTVLYRLEEQPETAEGRFADVEKDSWYERAVAWASENGIVKGVTETEFAPDAQITREQIALILFRYAAYKALDVTAAGTLTFTDADKLSQEGRAAVLWASENAMLAGFPDGSFVPDGAATRAQAAAVLVRFAAWREA